MHPITEQYSSVSVIGLRGVLRQPLTLYNEERGEGLIGFESATFRTTAAARTVRVTTHMMGALLSINHRHLTRFFEEEFLLLVVSLRDSGQILYIQLQAELQFAEPRRISSLMAPSPRCNQDPLSRPWKNEVTELVVSGHFVWTSRT